MPDRIGTVALDAGGGDVGHRDDVIGAGCSHSSDIGRDAIDRERVVRQRPGEYRRVEVSCWRGDELSDNLQLTGVVRPRQHGVHELGHAVSAGDLNVGITQAAYADIHIQPEVAVDQVVAATTHDLVAALAAEEDVAAVEAG